MEGSQYAGLIVYRIGSDIEFLLLNDSCSDRRHWTPPKGKVIAQEDERKCAERELFQTLGVTPSQLGYDPEFRSEIRYISGSKLKNVVYFLAQISPTAEIVTGNYSGFNVQWFPINQACEKAQYKLMQEALQAAAGKIAIKYAGREDIVQPLSDKMGKMRFSLDQQHQNYADRRHDGYAGGYRHEQPRMYSADYPRSYQKYSPPRFPQNQSNSAPYNAYQGHDSENDGYDYQKERREQYPSNPNMMLSYKTRLCGRYQASGECHYGNNCTFAHGPAELRGRPTYNNDQSRLNPPFYQNNNNRLRPRTTKSLTKETLISGYSPSNEAFEVRAPQSDAVDEGSLEHRYDLPRPIGLYRNLDQKPQHVQQPPALAHSLRPTEPANSIPHVRPVADDSAKFPSALGEQDTAQPQISKKKSQEPKPVPLKDLLKDPGVEKLKSPSNQSKKPLIDDKLLSEFRQIVDNPDLQPKDELRELTRMEFRHNLSKLQIFTLLIESLFPKDYDKKKLSDRVEVFLKFIVGSLDRETLLKALEKLISKSEVLMNSAVYIFKDMYDFDLIEEDDYIKWYSLCKNQELKFKVAPFIDWLCTAEEEE